jgi:transcriptional regulator EpsA
MSDTTLIDRFATERILHVIEESLKVSRRFQFFLWAQGALQGVLPHDVLLCVCGDFSSFRFKYDTFSRSEDAEQIIQKLIDPMDGLLTGIIKTWLNSAREPLLYAAGADGPACDPVTAELRRLGCGHALAHGAREVSSNEGSFFVFLQMPKAPESRQAHLLDLVMPHLHMALYRMLLWEGDAETPDVVPESVLSSREAEVLRWVGQGKTNQEIGQVLDISPITVKNHVQKILRKLGVSNRAQAVSKTQGMYLVGAEFRPQADGRVIAEYEAALGAQCHEPD